MSFLDKTYRSFVLTKFFTKGWGKPDHLKRLFEFRRIISNRDKCQHLVPNDYPVHIDKERQESDHVVLDGHFTSPFNEHVPGIMPKESHTARFQVILPKAWKGPLKPVCVHLAGTGDHYFGRRRKLMALPLLRNHGIASIMLENPYYGYRKPKDQLRSSLHYVCDLFVMGGALVLESLVLLHWCERQGLGPLGMTGISMGGHMASAAVTNWHQPISLTPCLSWTTSSQCFTRGVMSASIPWKLLQHQYLSDTVYRDELAKMIHSPEDSRRNTDAVMMTYSSKDAQHSVHTDPICDRVQVNVEPQMSDHKAHYHTSSHNHSNIAKNHPSSPHLKPTNQPTAKHKKLLKKGRFTLQEEVFDFMRRVMDDCTHLGNFSVPVDPELIVIVAAQKDAYILRDSLIRLDDLWPGSEVRYINAGHINSFVFHQDAFRKAISDAFTRQIVKYYS